MDEPKKDSEVITQTPNTAETTTEQTTPETPTQTETNAESPAVVTAAPLPAKKRLGKKKLLLILLIILLLAGGSAAAYYFLVYNKNSNKKAAPAATSQVQTDDKTTQTEDELSSTALPGDSEVKKCTTTGTALKATWLAERQMLKDLGILETPTAEQVGGQQYLADTNKYYKVGTTDKGQAIILMLRNDGPGGPRVGLVLETSPSKYSVIAAHSRSFVSSFTDENPSYSLLTAGVEIDKTSQFSELCITSISYSGQTLTDSYDGNGYDTEYEASKLKSIQTYPNGTLYEYTYKSDANYAMREFVFKRKDTLWQTLLPLEILTGFSTSSRVPEITWSDNTKNDRNYSTQFRGCGASSTIEIATTTTTADLTQIGADSKGTPVYEFTSLENPLFAIHYDEYKELDTNDYFSDDKDKALRGLTKESYKKTHPVFLVEDQFGRYIVYVKDDYNRGGGCGKPVVYLYPTKTTEVSVKVGADVVISEPAYGNGWDVTANPNGSLIHKGKQYNSLYWEGYGHGVYPNITSGVVVAHDQAASTITSQLKQLGLNAKESADFLEFWVPKIPNKPYVRLTWFGNSDLDRLAPLNITPAPDTVIRVFLDAEGLNQPIAITPQHLTAKSRKGFTVVEWGGLLDGKIL